MSAMAGPAIKVVTPEEAEDCDLVACMRVADVRRVAQGSTQQACNDCGESIWVAGNSPKTPIKVCVQCVALRLQGGNA